MSDNSWVRHPDFPFEDWQEEVAAGDTRLGYEAWVQHAREASATLGSGVVTLTRLPAKGVLENVIDIFFPDGDLDHESGSDEIGEVVRLLVESGWAPEPRDDEDEEADDE